MSPTIHPLIIVGAGPCGLNLAQGFRKIFPEGSPLILEKSRGVGGRMATRREAELTFDHGAQRLSVSCRPALGSLPFTTYNSCLFPTKGMTRAAKMWAADLDIHLNEKVVFLENKGILWEVQTETNARYSAEAVAITAPAPQAVDLLRQSHLEIPETLHQMRFSKAVVYLIRGDTTNPFLQRPFHELHLDDIHSISDQKAKRVSDSSAWVIVMSPSFSERHFDASDDALIAEGINSLEKHLPELHVHSITVKKWRYATSLQQLETPYLEVHPSLYILGDSFHPGVDGALWSAEGLLKNLQHRPTHGNLI